MSNTAETVLHECRITIKTVVSLDAGAALRGLETEIGRLRNSHEVHTIECDLDDSQLRKLQDRQNLPALLKAVRNGPSAETITDVNVQVIRWKIAAS